MNTHDSPGAPSAQDTSSTGHAGAGAAVPRPAVVDRLAQGAHEAIDHLADSLCAQARRARETFGHAGEKAQERAAHWRESGDEWTESVRCTVRENPLTALATALVAGLLIARLCR